MPTIYIDKEPYEVEEGVNLLHACLSLGFDIPYFCWHPAMHSVGACRLCAVKQFQDEKDTKGKIVMSCMTLAKDGTRISVQDPEVLRFRKAVIEWLMTNHPHDCPVCDEGGECHLQDMTQMAGHVYRRYRFNKRTYRNQYLGPFIRHEMNRCIQCYRCVRFYIEYAGGRDLDVFGWHNRVYFGRHEDGVLQSKFSGNLVEVCPTGVFTDKTFAKRYTRKWDLQTAPSICVHCGLGCNTIPGERYGVLRRIRNRFHAEVNGYFLCDRGRFGYEFVNDERRIKRVLVRTPEERFEPLNKDLAVPEIGDLLAQCECVVGIGSPRASLESNFALRRLVGADNFYSGTCETQTRLIGRVIEMLTQSNVRTASLQDVAEADAVLVLGEDVSNVAPMLELALRRSILRKPSEVAKELHIEPWNDAAVREALQTEKGPLFIATTGPTDLDEVATRLYRSAPDDIARLGFAVAHRLDPNAPDVEGLPKEVEDLVETITTALRDAERPLILSGTSSGSDTILESAANVAHALHAINDNTQICFTVGSCNSMGLGLIGGRPLESATQVMAHSRAALAIILENDLYRHLSVAQADKLFHAANNVVVIDFIPTPTTAKAHIVLPAATFAEASGTLVNNEGRAQRFLQVFKPEHDIQESWRWIRDIGLAANRARAVPWETFDDIVADLANSAEIFGSVKELSPQADFRMAGQAIPRQSHRYSGRTAVHAHIDVNEPRTPQDRDTPLSFSMEGYAGQPPSSLITHFWAPHWNSVQSVNKFQTHVGGSLRGQDPGKRLIVPQARDKHGYYADVPAPFSPRKGYVLIVPAYHVFGSEELSILSSEIAELTVKAYIAVSSSDVGSLPLRDDGTVEVAFAGISHFLPVRLSSKVPRGMARVPMGLPRLPWDGLPFWFKSHR
jgi:NADH-quinone oxidoreductase subunit G